MAFFKPFNLWPLLIFDLVHCVLELPVFSQHATQYRKTRIGSRQAQGFVEESISYHPYWTLFSGYYYVDITIGSPPQMQTVLLSTGSSNLYFNSINSSSCNSSSLSSLVCRGGTFNSSASKTYLEVAEYPAFDVGYRDDSEIFGSIGSDTLGIGQVSIDHVQFGLAEELDIYDDYATGILGLGYLANENEETHKLLSPLLSIPDLMVREKLAASRLFSIALDRKDKQGSVTFGGIDTTRYTGELATIDLINVTQPYLDSGGKNTTAIKDFITTITQAEYLTGVDTKILWESGSDSITAWKPDDPAVPVLLDPAERSMRVPREYYDLHIAPRFPYLDSSYSCDCAYANTQDKIRLTFADKIKIEVSVKDLIKPMVEWSTGRPRHYDNGTERCELLIDPGYGKGDYLDEAYLLGGPALESMYMVFDMDNNQISIAQAADNVAETSNIIPIEAGPGGLAKALAALNTSTTTSSAFPSSTASRAIMAPDRPSPVSTGVIAGVVVGGVAALALIGGAGHFLIRRKRKAQPKPGLPDDSSQDPVSPFAHNTKNPRFNGDPTLE